MPLGKKLVHWGNIFLKKDNFCIMVKVKNIIITGGYVYVKGEKNRRLF